jgi:DNA modification methylase
VSELTYLVGDVFDRLAEIPDGSIDVVITSPPFLALRSYLPADHPDKAKEIGSEASPAAFLDTLLELTAECGRVLAPHGSLCVELGDTYSGSGGAGGDYNPDGLREGQEKFDGSAARLQTRQRTDGGQYGNHQSAGTKYNEAVDRPIKPSTGWPMSKSLTGVPTLYPWSLAYGRNLLTGTESPAGLWRIRNIIVWARPNPPVGALGDKFRPATSYITVACRGQKRYFDLDAVRTTLTDPADRSHSTEHHNPSQGWSSNNGVIKQNVNGAPPLDWHSDNHPEDGDWLWKLSTQPYRGAHYATFPLELPTRLIMAMCPLKVCLVCGRPSERIVDHVRTIGEPSYGSGRGLSNGGPFSTEYAVTNTTLGWSDCGHNTWRTGRVLDPFAGSGTTLQAAQNVGRHATGIDLDNRNAHLAQDRVGMFLEVQP